MLSLPTRRTFETLGIMMIGDGVLAMVEPSRHVALWRGGPPKWSRAMRFFEERPALTAGLGLLELGLGVWLARSQSRRLQPA